MLLDAFDISSRRKTSSDEERAKLREQVLDTLERWGVRDFRTLALLPDHALASRLGETGTRLQQLARGASMRTLALCEPAAHFEEAMELESPVETLEPLSFVFNRLLEQLCARLEARALAVQELCLRLQLERRVADEESLSADELRAEQGSRPYSSGGCGCRWPCVTPKCFSSCCNWNWRRIRRALQSLRYGSRLNPRRRARHNAGCFLPITPEAEKLEITLARIHGVVGERRAGIARLLDTHRRDSFSIERFTAVEETRQRHLPHCRTSRSNHAWRYGCFGQPVSYRCESAREGQSIWPRYRQRTSRNSRAKLCGRLDRGGRRETGGQKTARMRAP